MDPHWAGHAALIEAKLSDIITCLPASDLRAAMMHALTGGKRIRGGLVIESATLLDLDPQVVLSAACAVEAMHAYSLVHDDLPAMDDDDLRRGQPTVHVKWDDATAILAGDALQALAFELVTDPRLGQNRADLARGLAQAAGAQGMVLGQARDIAAETATTPLSLEEITQLQAGKTGALIEWSATAGPCLAGADITPLKTYAQALGLAFQIQDDIIDATGDADTAGKAVGKDAEAGKATFVSLLGLDAAKKRGQGLVDQATQALSIYGDRATPLRNLAQYVITRDV